MGLSVIHADCSHQRYFTKEVLEHGAGYVVSNENAISGCFSFTFLQEHQAILNFPYCLDKKAIELAFNTFLNDYPEVTEIKSLSRQNLDFLGFKNKVYQKVGD